MPIKTAICLPAAILVCAHFALGNTPMAPGSGISSTDRAYLRGLAEDTWDCIAYYVEPATGLPYDTSECGEFSSVTNLGYYCATCALACRMNMVTEEEATRRVRQVLDAYERFQTYEGFSQSWNSVRTLKPAPHDTMISIIDSGNMAAGFALAAVGLPEIRDQANGILSRMNWTAFYDQRHGMLFGGYDFKRKLMDTGWHVGDYAGDGRMAAFWAIAVGAAPPQSWNNLNRKTEEHFGLTYYQPGWMGGGLFMQTQDGLLLDERFTPAGKSAADFAYAQMIYAQSLQLPAWGWSACFAPDGRYLGWGGLEVDVVTPHAAGMCAMYYPHKAAECLRKLQEMGARTPAIISGKQRAFGFRDSISLKNRTVSDKYLPSLDQTMFFFGLANALENRLVHRLFHQHPIVQQGLKLIPEYGRGAEPQWTKELARRDREPLPTPSLGHASGKTFVAVYGLPGSVISTASFAKSVRAWTRDKNDDTVGISVSEAIHAQDHREIRCLRVDFDLDSPNPAFGGISIALHGTDGSACNALRMSIHNLPSQLKVELHGKGGIGVIRAAKGETINESCTIEIPFTQFGGMITDWSNLDRIMLVLEDDFCVPKTGTMWIEEIVLVQSPESH